MPDNYANTLIGLFMPVPDDKWACCVFIYKWNYVNDLFLNTVGYNINNY